MSGDSADSQTSTTSQDNRAVNDNGSNSVTGNTGSSITITDQGAVKKAIDFASAAGSDVSKTFVSLIGANEKVINKVLDLGINVIDKGIANNAAAANQLAQAYTDAKGGATQDRNIVMLTIGAAAVVAYAVISKGK